jgi:hypothetical protein
VEPRLIRRADSFLPILKILAANLLKVWCR